MTLTQKSAKRLLDVLCSAVGLAVFAPLIVACIVVASIDCRGSGVFRQLRVGRNGQLFHVLKIRTMQISERSNQSTVTTANDNRITSSGRILRRLKLDELPQLWNVLLGQMSLVGPRPDVPGYADSLTGEARRVLELRPGITGPATIKYTNEEQLLESHADPELFNDTVLYPDKVRINLEYLDSYSLFDDIKYILITLRLVPIPNHLASDSSTFG